MGELKVEQGIIVLNHLAHWPLQQVRKPGTATANFLENENPPLRAATPTDLNVQPNALSQLFPITVACSTIHRLLCARPRSALPATAPVEIEGFVDRYFWTTEPQRLRAASATKTEVPTFCLHSFHSPTYAITCSQRFGHLFDHLLLRLPPTPKKAFVASPKRSQPPLGSFPPRP